MKNVEQLGSDSYLYGDTIDNQVLSIKLNNQTDIKSGQSINVGLDKSDMHWFDSNGISL